jgi:hypothetical protein
VRRLFVLLFQIVGALSTLVVTAIVVARLSSTWPQDDADGVQLTAAIFLLKARSLSNTTFYISFDGRDPSTTELMALQKEFANSTIRKISERSSVVDNCQSREGRIRVFPCERDDYLDIDYLIMPVKGVVFLHGRSAACTSQLIVMKWFSGWTVVSQRWFCA